MHHHAGERLLGETNGAIGHREDHRWNRQFSVPERVVNGKSAETRKTSEHLTVNHFLSCILLAIYVPRRIDERPLPR